MLRLWMQCHCAPRPFAIAAISHPISNLELLQRKPQPLYSAATCTISNKRTKVAVTSDEAGTMNINDATVYNDDDSCNQLSGTKASLFTTRLCIVVLSLCGCRCATSAVVVQRVIYTTCRCLRDRRVSLIKFRNSQRTCNQV